MKMTELFNLFSILLLCTFFALFFSRIILLKRKGINPFKFGKTDKSDFLLIPFMLLFLYVIFASVFSLPFPEMLIKPIVEIPTLSWIGLLVSTTGIVGFGLALKAFGNSFRVGIDDEKPDKLITNGIFSISRNPIYVSFIFLFFGLVLIKMNIASMVMLFCFFIPVVCRQIIREEKFMRGYYGDEYAEYCKKVRRFL
jgi:protein-S-isoprenylcysteine O-methyltransferase Ste14